MGGQNNIDQAFDKIKEIENNLEEDIKEGEQIEEELSKDEKKTEEAEKQEEEEIEEGEETGNVDEIEDAEQKEKKILQMLKKEEKETDAVIEDIEEELKYGGVVEERLESMEGTAEKDFKDARKKLESLISDFQNLQNPDKKGKREIVQRDFSNAEDILEEIRFSAEIFRRTLEHEERLVNELNEIENEEDNLEQLSNRLHEELEMDKKEIRELLVDSKHIQIPEDVEKAEMEGKELKNLLKHWNEEEVELERIDEKIQEELQELQNMIGEDEKIFHLMEDCLEDLSKLEEIMQKEKGMLDFSSNSSTAKTVLEDIDKTRKVLQNQLQEDKNMIGTLEDHFSSLKENAPTGAAKKTGVKAGLGLGKILVSIILLAIIYLFISFGNNPLP